MSVCVCMCMYAYLDVWECKWACVCLGVEVQGWCRVISQFIASITLDSHHHMFLESRTSFILFSIYKCVSIHVQVRQQPVLPPCGSQTLSSGVQAYPQGHCFIFPNWGSSASTVLMRPWHGAASVKCSTQEAETGGSLWAGGQPGCAVWPYPITHVFFNMLGIKPRVSSMLASALSFTGPDSSPRSHCL